MTTDEAQVISARDLPKYRCHKDVRAAKVLECIDHRPPDHPDQYLPYKTLVLDTAPEKTVLRVSWDWFAKHNPSAGGYYVLYEDGYTSFSPAKAFEEGYTKVDA